MTDDEPRGTIRDIGSSTVPARDYVGLIFCDTRRARSWQRALAEARIVAKIAETFGDESERGAYQVSVPRRDLPAANEIVTAVTRGELTLPGTGVSPTTIIAVILVVVLVAALARGFG